jgi:hypothetical protein
MPKTLVADQKAKLWIGFGFVVAGGAIAWFHPAVLETIPGGREIGTLMMIIGGVWLSIAIRCPRCRLKLFWYAISKKGLNEWSPWLLETKECPQCGYRSDT